MDNERPGFSTKDVIAAMIQIAPIMDKAWRAALDDDDIWRERARRHGRVRTWWLRRQLRHRAGKKASETPDNVAEEG